MARAITVIQSATNITAALNISISKGTFSHTFDNSQINNITPITWEVPFLGGMGKTSDYRISIQASAAFIKDNLASFVNADALLFIDLNQSAGGFTPHKGKINNIYRDANNLDVIVLHVFDSFFTTKPVFPRYTMADCYANPHPAVAAKNLTIPIMYGTEDRPIYLTPVNCELQDFNAPDTPLMNAGNRQTVLSTSSVWYNLDQSLGDRVNNNALPQGTDGRFLLTSKKFSSGNFISANSGDYLTVKSTQRRYDFYDFADEVGFNQNCFQEALRIGGYREKDNTAGRATAGYFVTSDAKATWQTQSGQNGVDFIIQPVMNQRIAYTNIFSMVAQNVGATATSEPTLVVDLIVDSGGGATTTNLVTQAACISDNAAVSLQVNSTTSKTMLNEGVRSYIRMSAVGRSTNAAGTIPIEARLFNVDFEATLENKEYKNYSVFKAQVNCTTVFGQTPDIDVIVKDIAITQSQVSTDYGSGLVDSYDNTNFKLSMYIDEQRPVEDVLNEIGEITATNYWFGNCGYLNYRNYVESDSTLHDFTITTCDINEQSFKLQDNPIGITTHNAKKASKITAKYAYNFTLGEYEKSVVANKANESFCDSIDAAGITQSVVLQTKYIMRTSVASAWLQNAVRKYTGSDLVVDFELPARFFNIEVCDYLKIQHPAIVGSESLFQATKVTHDYMNGKVHVTANELKNIN